MAIFTERNSRFNFVDENDVFVGFDAYQCCCESFGFKLYANGVEVYNDTDSDEEINTLLDGYNFVTNFCEDNEGGDGVVFLLVQDDCQDIKLELYNMHNGYYGHGFDMSVGSETIHSGSL